VGSRQQVPGTGKRVRVDQKNPRNFPPGDLRVSDADRDLALAELSEHFQAGRLTADEMQERTDQALRARTGKELSAIMADLPVVRPGATVAPVSKEPERRRFHWTPAATAVLAGVITAAVITGAVLSSPGHHTFVFPIWLVVAAFFVLRRIGHGGGHHHDHHQQHLDRHQERLDREQERLERHRRDLD
jgi:hypothetical protein